MKDSKHPQHLDFQVFRSQTHVYSYSQQVHMDTLHAQSQLLLMTAWQQKWESS